MVDTLPIDDETVNPSPEKMTKELLKFTFDRIGKHTCCLTCKERLQGTCSVIRDVREFLKNARDPYNVGSQCRGWK